MSKKTLNKTNLEALGAEQLAILLMEVSAGSADIKRRLRLELSHHLGVDDLSHEVRKRLASLRKSKSYVGWRKRKALIKDLATQAAMITEKIAPTDPSVAFDLLWQFIDMAPAIYGRVDDSKGDVGAVFQDALAEFEGLAARAVVDVDDLVDRVWVAVEGDGHGEWDGIISLIAPALGRDGLERLRLKIEAFGAAPMIDASSDHEAIQFLRQLRGGSDYAAQRKAQLVKECLQEIAAINGDTDAFIAQFSNEDMRRKDISAEVASLLLADDRADEALDVLRNPDQDPFSAGQEDWDDAYIATLLALEEIGEAQAHRWASFLVSLNADHLRSYLKLLPDFEDVEAEELAKNHVLEFPDILAALDFCLNWPDLLTAARLIQARAEEIDGSAAYFLAPASEALRVRYPLAAMQLLRAMIEHILEHAKSAKYGLAAEYLADCVALDLDIADYAQMPTHAQYEQMLQTRFARNFSFWAKVQG